MIKLNDILNEGKRISFRDMGISNLMDLKLYTDKLAKANIGWDQKGQALVFNNTNDAKKARQLLGLDEVNEAKGFSIINKARAKAALRQIKSGKRDDGMGKFTSELFGFKKLDNTPYKITDPRDLNKYDKFGLGEGKITEYGGSDYSKITSLQNYLTIDLDKFEKGLKDSKHKAIYKKARKQFMRTVSDVAFEHSKLHEDKLNEVNKSDVKYAMKMAFDSVPGNWHKALKKVDIQGNKIKLNMSSYMGPGKVLQKIVDQFNTSMGTKFKIDKNSFQKGSVTSIELREGKK